MKHLAMIFELEAPPLAAAVSTDLGADVTWLTVVVAVLCAARITRLITTDSITEELRLRLSTYDWSRKLVNCPWCIGFWVSAATAVVTALLWPDPWIVTAMSAFAISHAVGFLATITTALETYTDYADEPSSYEFTFDETFELDGDVIASGFKEIP